MILAFNRASEHESKHIIAAEQASKASNTEQVDEQALSRASKQANGILKVDKIILRNGKSSTSGETGFASCTSAFQEMIRDILQDR